MGSASGLAGPFCVLFHHNAANLEEVLKPGSFSRHVSIWLCDNWGQRPWRAWPRLSTILVSQSPDADEDLTLSTLLRTSMSLTDGFSVPSSPEDRPL